MEKSDVYKTIVKLQKYCEERACITCELNYLDDRGEYICTLDGVPMEWGTGEIPCNVLEEQEG